MICQECNQNDATVHFTQMMNGEKKEMKICAACAKKKGFQTQIGTVDNVVSNMISDGQTEESEEAESKICRKCETSYRQFKSSGRLGCSDCYIVFEDKLKEVLRKIHGSIKHVGKIPSKVADCVQVHHRVEELREQLRKAVKAEQFEEAALLRDEIKRIESCSSETA